MFYKILILLNIIIIPFFISSASAQPIELEVKAQKFQPIKIALALGKSNQPILAKKMHEIIKGNLKNSGLFEIVDERSFMENPSIDAAPTFEYWRNIQAAALGVMDLKVNNGQIESTFRLWDIYSGTQLLGQKIHGNQKSYHRYAHQISDIYYQALTHEGPYFNSKIVFVDERGSKKNRKKRLAIMDQNGDNIRYLTNGREQILSPRYAMKQHKVVYTTLQKNGSALYLINLRNGAKIRLLYYPNRMVFSPTLSPDGTKIAFSMVYQGNTNLYIYDIASKRVYSLTSGFAIDTSPSFSPDGSQIVFNSDRGGSQQLYVMPLSGGQPKRISYGKGRYATPAWSPKGDKIAFTRMSRGKFSIGVMDVGGDNEKILASSFLDEAPSWAPNGRSLVFFRGLAGRHGASYLHVIDISGYLSQRRIPTPSYASDPSWSPLL